MNNDYFAKYINELNSINKSFDRKKAIIIEKKILDLKNKNNKIIFFGNGGSAAIINHFLIDFNKNLNIKTQTFNEATITCLANDYGFSNWMKKALELNVDKKDLVILVSSSGNSTNHLKAADYCKKKKIFSISFTGFKKNKLSKKTNLSFIVNSKNYNIIENTHSTWLLMILDKLKKNKI